LLEVLDPEQNSEFVDHYLDLEIDLSHVFFITTANTTDPIPPALKDRMEIIEITGYTEREKLSITRNFLVKKQAEKNGLTTGDFEIADEQVLKIVNRYTREAGVRNLERQIAIVIRKIARHFVEEGKAANKNQDEPITDIPFILTAPQLEKFLGIPKFNQRKILEKDEVGVSIGLAWTQAGG
ncbi:MAG: endopeptidase La, partial [bacterium]|nr:endopeptidase La [bacterium]